ncbi:hypothetical protein [Rheinheimera sp.]|uniref:hypothetical protein n=1 Tax=Rheinheimera sp. TaxID=1869214 RepID=UPI00307FBEB2
MLPDKLYEALPYLYLACGGVTTLCSQSFFTLLPAMLLFTTGAWTWVIRTEKRRNSYALRFQTKAGWPFWWYEFYPFVLMLSGLVLLGQGPNGFWSLPAVVALVFGLQFWCSRLSCRTKGIY